MDEDVRVRGDVGLVHSSVWNGVFRGSNPLPLTLTSCVSILLTGSLTLA